MANTIIQPGARNWEMTRDDDWHRTYTIKHIVIGLKTPGYSGPYEVHKTAGLPTPGAPWDFDGDTDPWAFCWPGMKVEPMQKDPSTDKHWEVTQVFSTRPRWKCNDSEEITDPVLEPPRISGSWVQSKIQAVKDRNGRMNTNSSHEPYTGPEAEYDDSRPAVEIVKNYPNLDLSLLSQMVNTLNDSDLWGLPPRCIKFSSCTWARNAYGECNFYFTLTMQFDVNFFTFDRFLLDHGTKALHGQNKGGVWEITPMPGGGNPDMLNPMHFSRYKDANGENARVLLNGNGLPLLDFQSPVYKKFEYYRESNFLLLNLPEDLEAS